MSKIYLSSYRPLTRSKTGQEVAVSHNIPPYVDDSIRREPDFESIFPSITALCRFKMFAPKLAEGDKVVYLTHKNRYPGMKFPARRLTAILEVLKRFESHEDAAVWYFGQNIQIPRNCMIRNNPPLPISLTSGKIKLSQRSWDGAYQLRASQCGVFLACTPVFRELQNPPIVTEEMLTEVFSRVPGTRNPPQITQDQYEKLLRISGM